MCVCEKEEGGAVDIGCNVPSNSVCEKKKACQEEIKLGAVDIAVKGICKTLIGSRPIVSLTRILPARTWVDLAVGGDTVGVDDGLEAASKLGSEVGGWGFAVVRNVIEDGLHVAAGTRRALTQRKLHLVHLGKRVPALGN